MNVDISYQSADQVTLQFQTAAFSDQRDYLTGLAIFTTFCTEFELEPEMDPEGFQQLVESIVSKDKERFKMVITPEDIDVLLEDDES